MAASDSWNLTSEERSKVADRTSANLFSLAFSAEKEIDQKMATESATRLEEEAYVSAQAQSVTTTGIRPAIEVLKAYVRKLAELVIEFVKGLIFTRPSSQETKDTIEGVFDLRGRRDFLSKELAERLFSPLLSDDTEFHTIILSTKSFGVDAAQVAADVFARVAKTFRKADLSDIIGGRPEHEALDVLRVISSSLTDAYLEELNLSSNALGQKGLRACAELFQSQKQLKKLTLHNIGCSSDACSTLEELTQGMDLQGLFLYNNMSGDDGAIAISKVLARMPSIERFQMSSSRVEQVGFQHLTQCLCGARNLLELDLNDNPATSESVPGIIQLLSCQHSLRQLNLSDTCLKDDGIRFLSACLAQHGSNIEVLELALNEMTVEGAKALGRALPKLAKLQKLDLCENELEDSGVLILAKALAMNQNITVLNFSENQIHTIGALTLISCIKGKKGFQKLYLDGNNISEDGILQIKEILFEHFGTHDVLGSLDDNDEEEDEDEMKNDLKDLDFESLHLEGLIDAISTLSL